ncbi:MAG: acetylxylan esterase [Planctomycetota bacterium]
MAEIIPSSCRATTPTVHRLAIPWALSWMVVVGLLSSPIMAQDASPQTTRPGEAKRPAPDLLRGVLEHPILYPAEAHKQLRAFLLKHVAKLELPDTSAEWTVQAGKLRREILNEVVMKGVPAGWLDEMPRFEYVGRVETGRGYVIRKLRYEGYPGLWVPALLYEPTSLEPKAPVVLNVNGHADAIGKAVDYKQIRCINLAKRGMLAMNLEWIGFGELTGECLEHERLRYLDLCGRSGLSVFYLTLKRGLDVLLRHPNADARRVAVTGLSGGGWQTILLSALDPRVTTVVPVAGYITLDARATYSGDIGDFEESPTDLLRMADYSHLTAMLAPRPTLLIYNEKDNCCYPTQRSRGLVYEPVLPLYERYGAGSQFQFYSHLDPGDHNYGRDNREALYRFLNRQFYPDGSRLDEEIPCEEELKTPEELRVGVPEQNADFCTLAEAVAADMPRMRCRADGREAVLAWQRQARRTLAEVVRFQPAPASAAVVQQQTFDGLTVSWCEFSIGEDWTIPAVELVPARLQPKRTAVVIADLGRSGAEATARVLVDRGYRVVVLDVFLLGETVPPRVSSELVGQMISSVGARPLGIAAAQLLAVVGCVKKQHPDAPVSVVGVGPITGVIALVAAALDRDSIDNVSAVQLLPTLKLLIENRGSCPHLFCFGLLERFDVRELIGLCLPRPVTLVRTFGDAARVDLELAPLDRVSDAINAPRVHRFAPSL